MMVQTTFEKSYFYFMLQVLAVRTYKHLFKLFSLNHLELMKYLI